jgi:hypothetical protein
MSKKFGENKRSEVYKKTGGKCWYCGCELSPYMNRMSPDLFVIEHQIPISRGGTNETNNLVPACRSCNSQKAYKTVEEFRSYVAFLSIGVKQFSADQLDYLESLGLSISPYPVKIVFWGEDGET